MWPTPVQQLHEYFVQQAKSCARANTRYQLLYTDTKCQYKTSCSYILYTWCIVQHLATNDVGAAKHEKNEWTARGTPRPHPPPPPCLPPAPSPAAHQNRRCSGTWKFSLASSVAKTPAGFQDPGFQDSSWHDINVPGHWQLQCAGAADPPIYTNTNYPFPNHPPYAPRNNPTGLYRRKFSLPAGWLAAGGDGAGGVDGLLNENFQLVEVTGVGWSGFGTRVRGGPNLRNGIFEVNLVICKEARAFFFVNIIDTDRAAPLRHYKLRLTWQWCGLLYILGNIALAGGVVVALHRWRHLFDLHVISPSTQASKLSHPPM